MLALVALALWLLTLTLGASELIGWRRSPSPPPPLAYQHAATALTGLAVWVGFVLTDRAALAWLALVVLAVNNGLGDLLTTAGWRRRHAGGTPSLTRDLGSAVGEVLRLRRRGRVVAHALLGGATFFCVLVAAALA